MKLGQLKKKIAKEFAKSPAKTVVLIALCPVALYFVVPLFLPAKPLVDEAQRAKVITSNLAPATMPLASISALASFSSGPNWQQLNRWMDADGRRKPGLIAADQRSPFQPPAIEVEDTVTVREDPVEESVAGPAFSREAFAAMGFKLTGTLVGHHSRSATINGRRYLEGAVLTSAPNKPRSSAGEKAFVLKHVGARHVDLELDGLSFRLELNATSSPSSGITVVRGTGSAFH